MSDRRETVVNVEREPTRTHTVYRESGSGGTGVLVGVVLAILVILGLAFVFWPASEPARDTNVTVETPAAPPPAASQPAPAEPPAASAPAAPAEPAPAPAPAPAQ